MFRKISKGDIMKEQGYGVGFGLIFGTILAVFINLFF